MLMMYAVPLLIIIFSYGSIYYEIFQKSRMKNSGEHSEKVPTQTWNARNKYERHPHLLPNIVFNFSFQTDFEGRA